MAKEKFENVSDTELLTEQKKLKKLNKIYGIILSVFFLISIYLGFTKGNFTMVAVCIALFSIYIVNIQSLKDFKKEVEMRKITEETF